MTNQHDYSIDSTRIRGYKAYRFVCDCGTVGKWRTANYSLHSDYQDAMEYADNDGTHHYQIMAGEIEDGE